VSGIIDGFLVIAAVILVGYLLARRGVLGAGTQRALSEVVFFVGAPALLFATLAGADIGRVLSSGLAVTAVSSLSVAAVFAVVARFAWRRDVAGATVGALASSYVNAGNLGIPITVYVLGDAEFVAPVMLFQLIVIAPAAFAVLDAAQLGRRPSIRRVLSRPVRNPVTVASTLGLLFAATGWDLPDLVWQPIELLGAMAVPMALLAFGISLHGAPLPGRGGSGRDVVLVAALKNVGQPLLAWLFARLALGLGGRELLAVTLCASLPTAQNVFVYAVRYRSGIELARDAISVTTMLAVPVILLVAIALG